MTIGWTRPIVLSAMLALSPLVLAVPPANAHDEHAMHRAQMANAAVTVSERSYAALNATLRDERGKPVELGPLLNGNRPIVLNFIYTSCTTICPVMTATLLQLQQQLSKSDLRPDFVSISVDPDFDSPQILQAYAHRHGAQWTFLTGEAPVVLQTLRQFDAWRGNKVNHAAITLMKLPGAANWTRIEGLASAQQLAAIWSTLKR
jgi:protein SCO1